MTSRRNDGRAVDRIVAVLAAVAPDFGPLPAGGWAFTLADGWPVRVRARILDGEWLELTTRIKGLGLNDAADGWRLLALNARLTGAARVAATFDGSLLLRGEAPVATDGESTDESRLRETNVGDWVRRLCDDFRTALHQVHDTNPACLEDASTRNARVSLTNDPVPDGGVVPPVAALCTEAGWAATERATGEVAVRVETRHAAYQAFLSLGSGDSFQALVPLGDVEPTMTESRAATSRLLLILSGAVRLVKGVVVYDGETVRPGIAAACAPPRTGADMARILSALSVACGLAGREVRALTDRGLARAYLSLGSSQEDVAGHTKIDATESHEQQAANEKERVCLQ